MISVYMHIQRFAKQKLEHVNQRLVIIIYVCATYVSGLLIKYFDHAKVLNKYTIAVYTYLRSYIHTYTYTHAVQLNGNLMHVSRAHAVLSTYLSFVFISSHMYKHTYVELMLYHTTSLHTCWPPYRLIVLSCLAWKSTQNKDGWFP